MVKPRLSSECQVLHLEELGLRSSPDVFQQQGLRHLSGSGEKIRTDQSTETSLEKTCSRALRTSYWSKASASSTTITRNAQPRQNRSGFSISLPMPLSGQVITLLNICVETWKSSTVLFAIQPEHERCCKEKSSNPCVQPVASFSVHQQCAEWRACILQ